MFWHTSNTTQCIALRGEVAMPAFGRSADLCASERKPGRWHR